ncbi:MAG: type I DNA topoisomerase [Lentisphaerae bacterium]|nr:type I DNA topoisomerase [Lentisphaerota bacterium]
MKKLLIVESPAKAKTIGKYLGGEFTVKSSVGHIRDLPKKGGLAIKIAPVKGAVGEWTFTPSYEISPEKKKVVSELRAAAKAADEIYLAPDPDREGEAIAWHLSEVLAKETSGKPVSRVTYNEITKAAVQEAIANPGQINAARVDAQQARRILDRLVGFQVSPMLWKYLSYGRFLSAGRVQSVALRLLVEREREIRGFVPVPYWMLGVEAKKDAVLFTAKLARIDGRKPEICDETMAASVVSDLEGAGLRVSSVKDQPKSRHPYPPFTTSTLQQAASSVCGFSPHRTMGLAQKLYEAGLITYMRTDSVNIAKSARDAAKSFIESEYGSGYLPETPNIYRSKSGAQEAHEAIRPTDVLKKPDVISGLDSYSAKLYDLIWRRFVASQMADAKFSLRTISFEPEKPGIARSYAFTASTTAVVFEGFLKAMPSAAQKRRQDADDESDEAGVLPPLAVGDRPEVLRWLSDRKETKPPARFSEAALVKALEENGVGRPSTYAQTIEVLVNRQYATRESRQLVPTKRGEDVNDWLVLRMPALFDVGYTAQMEGELDKVEEGGVTGEKMLSDFYSKFQSWLQAAKEPPPDPGRFRDIFAVLDDVNEWREPKTQGKRTFDDRAFVESVREQMVNEPEKLSERQLRVLAAMAVSYRDQIPDADARLSSIGWAELVEKAKDAPPEDLVRDSFRMLESAGLIEGNKFLSSLHRQFMQGRTLSERQFAVLVRSVCENAGDDELSRSLKSRLSAFAPAAAETPVADPTLPGLVAMMDEIKTWRDPVKRGKRTFDDREFAGSLSGQFVRRKTLTPRQVSAMKKMLFSYREQIQDYAARAAKLGLPTSAPEKKRKGGKSRS